MLGGTWMMPRPLAQNALLWLKHNALTHCHVLCWRSYTVADFDPSCAGHGVSPAWSTSSIQPGWTRAASQGWRFPSLSHRVQIPTFTAGIPLAADCAGLLSLLSHAALPSKEQWRLHSSEAGVGTWDSLHARGKLHVTPCPVQQGFLPGSSAEGWRNWWLELPADLKLFFFSCGSWKGY